MKINKTKINYLFPSMFSKSIFFSFLLHLFLYCFHKFFLKLEQIPHTCIINLLALCEKKREKLFWTHFKIIFHDYWKKDVKHLNDGKSIVEKDQQKKDGKKTGQGYCIHSITLSSFQFFLALQLRHNPCIKELFRLEFCV